MKRPGILYAGICLVVASIMTYFWVLPDHQDTIGSPAQKENSTTTSTSTPFVDTTRQSTERKEQYANKLSSRESSIQELRRIRVLPTSDVYQTLLNGFTQHNDDWVNFAQSTLRRRAQAHDPDVVPLLEKGIVQDQTNQVQKITLISLLGEIGTAESASALMRIVTNPVVAENAINDGALKAIGNIGRLNDDGTFNEEVSLVLEQYLGKAKGHGDLLYAIAKGISGAGSESGMEKLLDAVGTAATEEERNMLEEAMSHPINRHAVPPLEHALEADPSLTGVVAQVAGNTLSSMTADAATVALLSWATQLEDNALQQQALLWLQKTQCSDAALNQMEHATIEYKFKDMTFGQEIELMASKINAERNDIQVEYGPDIH